MSKICQHGFVSGIVQGVFFRDNTQKQAHAFGIKGWVRNCLDGRVEVFFCGEEQQVTKMAKWLWQGSPASKVTNVQIETVPWEPHDGFHIIV